MTTHRKPRDNSATELRPGARLKQQNRKCLSSLNNEQGVSLLEVMIALFILAFGALAIANMQTNSLVAVKISSNHLNVSSISEEIVEHLKADTTQASQGTYNTLFADTAAIPGLADEYSDIINSWKNRTAELLPDGATQINCADTECTVSLRWRESIVAGVTQQVFNLKVPLEAN